MMTDAYRPGALLGMLLRRWWMIAVALALGLGLSYAVLRAVPPTYEATATQLVKGIPGSTTGANYIAAQFAVARAKSYPVFIFSSAVLQGVRKDMGEEFTDERLRRQLSARNPVDTPLVQVTATAGTPAEAQALADSAATHLASFITAIETVSGKSPIQMATAVNAELPVEPTSPQAILYLGVGATGGLALGAIVALAFAVRSSTGSDAVGRGASGDVEPAGKTEP